MKTMFPFFQREKKKLIMKTSVCKDPTPQVEREHEHLAENSDQISKYVRSIKKCIIASGFLAHIFSEYDILWKT